jgi:hypothetical protein
MLLSLCRAKSVHSGRYFYNHGTKTHFKSQWSNDFPFRIVDADDRKSALSSGKLLLVTMPK